MSAFELLPTLVMASGRVVLPEGETVEAARLLTNPLALGWAWRKNGAQSLYLVALDRPGPRPPAVGATLLGLGPSGLRLWVGGGIRHRDTVNQVLAVGADAAVVRSAASSPERLARLLRDTDPSRVVMAMDLPPAANPRRRRRSLEWLAPWTDLGIVTFLVRTPGLVADLPAAADEALAEVSSRTTVYIEGGVRTKEDIDRLHAAGVRGAVVRSALYSGFVGRELFGWVRASPPGSPA